MHSYRSAIMGIPEARRGQRLVLRYNRQALDDWIIVAKDKRNLLVKVPDSTDGLAIQADWSLWVGDVSGVVEFGDPRDLLFGRLLVRLAPYLSLNRRDFEAAPATGVRRGGLLGLRPWTQPGPFV